MADSYSSVVPFLVGLGGGLFYGRFLLYYRAIGLVSLVLKFIKLYTTNKQSVLNICRSVRALSVGGLDAG